MRNSARLRRVRSRLGTRSASSAQCRAARRSCGERSETRAGGEHRADRRTEPREGMASYASPSRRDSTVTRPPARLGVAGFRPQSFRSWDPVPVASEVDDGKDSVILASFDNRRAAERMVASLGRGFRKKHRKGHATALVISGNKDGSLRVTQSRVVSAGGVVYTGMHIALSVALGFIGMLTELRGAKGAVHEVHQHASHVGPAAGWSHPQSMIASSRSRPPVIRAA